MPNFQGAVNQVLDQAGLYASLAGGPQDLKETIKLGKAEKTNRKQLENVGKDLKESMARVKEAKETGDYSAVPELTNRAKVMGEELDRLGENISDIRARQYQLNPSDKNYEAYMKTKGIYPNKSGSKLMTKAAYNNRVAERDERRAAYERSRSQQLKEAAKKQKEEISSYIGSLPTSLGGKVKDFDPTLREQIIAKYMEANDGEQE